MREGLQALVRTIEPFDTTEEAHAKDVLLWLATASEVYRLEKPATPPKHLVVYFVVYDPVKEWFLLVHHLLAGKWLPSGGHVELNEHPRETVIREAREELAIRAYFLLEDPFFLTVTETVGTVEKHTDVSLWFIIQGDANQPVLYDPREFDGAWWFSRERILKMPIEQFDPHFHRFVKKWGQRTERVGPELTFHLLKQV